MKRTTKNTTGTKYEIGDDLVITKTTRRAAGSGTWVIGNVAYPFMWW